MQEDKVQNEHYMSVQQDRVQNQVSKSIQEDGVQNQQYQSMQEDGVQKEPIHLDFIIKNDHVNLHQELIKTNDKNVTETQNIEINASTLLDKINASAITDPSTRHIIEIDGQKQMVFLDENQHIIILPKQYADEIENQQPIYIQSEEENQSFQRYYSYDDFKRALNEYEAQTITKFILRNQSKQFQAEVCLHDIIRNEKNSSDLPLIRWEFCAARDYLPIPFMGIPYISVGKQVFQCHQGKDYNTNKKQQYELRKEILNQATRFQIKSRNKGPSKKLDCPVLFAVRKLYFFPEFQLTDDTKRNRGMIAQKIRGKLMQIRKQKCKCHVDRDMNNEGLPSADKNTSSMGISNGNETIGHLEYLTKFPTGNQHNHDVLKAANFMKLQLKKHGAKGVEIMQSKKPAQVNPYEYDKHVELINTLRTAGDLDLLRTAREDMSKIYPLSEELWLEWFQDELPLSLLAEQKDYLISKFDLAVKDYTSTKIWNEYCQYMMNNIESPADIEHARNVFERAITAVGLHVTEGSCIWDGYREFEIAILDSYQQLQDSGDTVGMDAKVQDQIEKIATIFKRQLSVPLLGMSDTYKIFDDWQAETIPGDTRRAHQKALEKLQACMQYEEKLHAATGSKYAEYMEYIMYEMKDGDPRRIQCIFERALKDNCLLGELWEKYTNYLDFKLKIRDIALIAHERAVRNCPWQSNLWKNYLRALERNNVEYARYKDVFDQSLKGGFSNADGYLQIWVENCDYHRRRITHWGSENEKIEELHKAYETGVTYMSQYFGLEGDDKCVLLREWALIEAKYLQNGKRAQELWDTVMKKHLKDCVMWLEYINFLKLYADVLTVRRVFQRAVQITMDYPERLSEAFLTFERQYGNLTDVDDAQQKIEVLVQKVKEKKEKEALKESQMTTKDKNKHKSKDESWSKKKKRKLQERETLKRSLIDESPEKNNPKKLKEDSSNQEPVTDSGVTSSNTTTSTNIPSCSDAVHGSDPAVERITTDSTDDATSIDTETKTAECTEDADVQPEKEEEKSEYEVEKVNYEYSVFLSNMLFTVDQTHLQNMFEKCGDIDIIRIVQNAAGKSKGFAYLQFKTKDAVEKALKLDRESLLGRPVFVSKCVDKKINPTQFKFPTGLDKHTVYVTNLPFELTSEELTQHFLQIGAITQARLVTNRSGKSKGYAYVEYKNEADATSAILKLDKTTLNNRPINVALSNPPARKQAKTNDVNSATKVLGLKPKTMDTPGSRVRSKTQISFVPGVLLKNQRQSQLETNKKDDSHAKDTTTTSTSKLNNDDFRKFLAK